MLVVTDVVDAGRVEDVADRRRSTRAERLALRVANVLLVCLEK
jgi:hypothetical protein